ncbi:MAG TPA: hypothetical protein VJV03_13990 [Pyrinomonadaceae bacterium]|nr:hypothetical protein [Pyrinomonadaceae bacterium]
MSLDPKVAMLRHLVATVVYRGGVALLNAPDNFAAFRINQEVRSPAEILAHIGDLLEGALYLLKGELVHLRSKPLAWTEEVSRFYSAASALDVYLASGAPPTCPVEKLIQGPVGDALTHVGQMVMMRRLAGSPVHEQSYFTAEITPGVVNR